MTQAVEQGGPAPAEDGSPPQDGTALRTNFSHGPEDAARLRRLCERFGRDKSAMIRYALDHAEGSLRLYRHAIRGHVHKVELLGREVRLTWPGRAEAEQIAADLAKAAAAITALFEEPRV